MRSKFIKLFILLLSYSSSLFAAQPINKINLNQGNLNSDNKNTFNNDSLRQRLLQHQFPISFINKLLVHYDDSKREQVIKLNVMGFLASPNYSGHYSEEGLNRCRAFLIKYSSAFKVAEKKYHVKKEIIAALLWVESRLGENHGDYHVASVFLNLLQSDQPTMVQSLLNELSKKEPEGKQEFIQKTKDRAKSKAHWAIDELWSLLKMEKQKPGTIESLNGSFSGAFGYSQFLPSSYIAWARSFNKKARPNLYKPEDAIVSVAHYLQKNGFKKNKPSSYLKSLYRYNKSHDYGDVILKISRSL